MKRLARIRDHRARLVTALGAALLCSGVVRSTASPERSVWDEVAATAGLSPDQLRFPSDRWRGGGRHALAYFDRLWDDWTLMEEETARTARQLLAAAPSFAALLEEGVRRASLAPPEEAPVASAATDLASAIEAVHEATGECLSFARSRLLRAQVASIPTAVATRAARLLAAVPAAIAAREAALARFHPGERQQLRLARRKAIAFARNYVYDPEVDRLLASFDAAALVQGARVLARALDEARREPIAPVGSFAFSWRTPAGTIELAGDGDDVHDRGPYLLALDTGGKDTYRNRTDRDAPVQLLLDLGGDDAYESPCAAVLGTALHYDASGDDRYEADERGMGCGVFGVAILIDARGDDRYEGRRLVEGAAVVGVGVLADLAGDDSYACLIKSQAYAATRAFGALVDAAGNDRYVADDAKVVVPSPQTAEHNTSLSQGAAYGRRAHPGDGNSLAGGVAFLVDGGGDDRYSCGVFGQGTGYWYAFGALVDLGGDDVYEGVWYVQGSSAHYALACLLDLGGRDRYVATMHQSQGGGHDWSVGLLVDGGGDDEYRCAGWGLASGNANGIGAFRDDGGNDRYVTGGDTCGRGHSADGGRFCLGLFVDRAGKDRYEPEPAANALPAAGAPGLYGLRLR